MTAETKRRLVIYPLVLVALSGLVYGGFVYEAEADVPTLVNSAEVLAQVGVFDKSIEFAERALEQEPDNRYAHIILGYGYGETGEYERSLRHYGRAVELTDPQDESRGILRLYRAEVLIRAGRAEEGARVAGEVIDLDPGQSQALYTLGRARSAQKRWDEARDAFRAARERLPGNPEPLVLLADLERDQGNLARALALLGEAAELSPGSPGIAVRTAVLHVRSGDLERAVEVLRTAAETKLAPVRRALHQVEDLQVLREDPRIRELLSPERNGAGDPAGGEE